MAGTPLPKKHYKQKLFFACAFFLTSIFILSMQVSADAPEDVIINVLNNYPKYFKQNNLISDAFRYLSWIIILLLKYIVQFCVSLYDYSLGFFTLISRTINDFVPYAHELFTAILSVSLLVMGVILILSHKKKPDILISLFLVVVALSLQTVVLSPMIAPTQSAARELAMTTDISQRIISSHVHDLVYIDQSLGNGLSDLSSGSIDINTITRELSDQQIDNIDINEVLNYENSQLSEGASGQDGILGKELTTYYGADGSETHLLTDIYNGFGWNTEDRNDFFNNFYYRYKIDSLEIILALFATIIVYLFMSYKVIKIVIEIVTGNILAIFYSANFNSTQKVVQILKEILNAFIVLLLSAVLIRIFIIGEQVLSRAGMNGIQYSFLLIFLAFAIIDGPNIIQRIVGVDAGISSELSKLFAFAQLSHMGGSAAAVTAGVAGSLSGAALKGAGALKQRLSEASDSSANADIPPETPNSNENSSASPETDSNTATPPDSMQPSDSGTNRSASIPPVDMHNGMTGKSSSSAMPKGKKHNGNTSADMSSAETQDNMPDSEGSVDADITPATAEMPLTSDTSPTDMSSAEIQDNMPDSGDSADADITPGTAETPVTHGTSSADIPPENGSASATTDSSSRNVPQESSQTPQPSEANSSVNRTINENASAIGRMTTGIDLSSDTSKSNYEKAKDMNAAYTYSQSIEQNQINGISGLSSAQTTSADINWDNIFENGGGNSNE